MSSDLFDVAIIGAGPAGSAAAIALTRKGRRVVIVDRDTFPRSVPCAGWVGVRAAGMLAEWGVKTKRLLNVPINDVTLFNADLSKSAKPAFDQPPGFLVDRGRFDQALVEAAVKNTALFVQGCAAADLRLNESSVTIQLADGRELESRLLLLASGRASSLLARVRVAREPERSPVWAAHVLEELPSGAKRAHLKVSVVLGLDGGESFGFCWVFKNHVSANVMWVGAQSDTGEALSRLCRCAFEKQVLPIDLSEQATAATVIRTPVGEAMEMDSHVSKHTLLIGDAGGFVSAVSNEGIYPAMWSAKIAAEVVDEALDSDPTQDALMTFNSRWRMEMGDHLRSPHTDVRFLLPLIFTNQPMADRMGAAFFFGENI